MDMTSSSAESEEENKLPLKRVELSLSKFNEVAIPHHLGLLRQHKANIVKYGGAGQYGRVRVEQEAARRAAARLRALLQELEALRRAVRAPDRPAFDALTARAAADTRAAIADLAESSPMMMRPRGVVDTVGVTGAGGGGMSSEASSVASGESFGVVGDGDGDDSSQVQLEVDEGSLAAREREEALRGWSALQEEVGALHEAWRAVHEAACAQRGTVARVEERVEVADGQAEAARAHLATAERLRGAGGAAAGAALGALAGGPVGLLVGLKAGAAAALAGSLLGYAAGRLLPARRVFAPAPTPTPDKDKAA